MLCSNFYLRPTRVWFGKNSNLSHFEFQDISSAGNEFGWRGLVEKDKLVRELRPRKI